MSDDKTYPIFSDQDILEARGVKAKVNPRRPYAFIVEKEYVSGGKIEETATVFLTNRECPFRCLMCDLWKHTTDVTVAAGDIPAQIDYALARLPETKQIKLYNSGNFFDAKAIPPGDYGIIADRLRRFRTVVVENHPKLCVDAVLHFRDLLEGKLEVALGLETVHPEILKRLNKRMTLDDFERAVSFLRANDIDVRAFILLKPPFQDEKEGITWTLNAISFAFDTGVQCCSIIPTRTGNGIMERLEQAGYFSPPSLSSIETVLEAGIRMEQGPVFMDLWDLKMFYDCPECGPLRQGRLHEMNLTQQILPSVNCSCVS